MKRLAAIALLVACGCSTRVIPVPWSDTPYQSMRIGAKESFSGFAFEQTPSGGYKVRISGYQSDTVEGIRAAAEGAAAGAVAASGKP